MMVSYDGDHPVVMLMAEPGKAVCINVKRNWFYRHFIDRTSDYTDSYIPGQKHEINKRTPGEAGSDIICIGLKNKNMQLEIDKSVPPPETAKFWSCYDCFRHAKEVSEGNGV